MAVQTFAVTGMSCGHCVAAVTGELSKLTGVNHVDIDLTTGTVTVDSTAGVSADEFAAAIDEAGFEVST